MVVDRYHEAPFNDDYIKRLFEWRKKLDVPCVTDCGQFMFIDYIRKVDKDATFIWIVRNKENCIKSFMQRPAEDKRIHPRGWVFKPETKKELIEWYYDEVNKIIENFLVGAKYQKIKTEDMPKVDTSQTVIYSKEIAENEDIQA